MAIQEGGEASATGNRVHDCKEAGVLVWQRQQGHAPERQRHPRARAFWRADRGGRRGATGNCVSDCKLSGVFVHGSGSKGTLSDNDIHGHEHHGVSIEEGGEASATGNRVYDCKQSGVGVSGSGSKGTLSDNDIHGHGLSGVSI